MNTKPINVLSLFDGISCGQLALQRSGISVSSYTAGEIDKHAIKIAMKNFPNTIQLGDVSNIHIVGGDIDLLIGGSPCQGFSFAGKQLNFEDPRSKLFFEYVRILNEIKKYNPDVKFLLENVKMKKEYQDIISEYLGVQPIEINSALLSAQNRKRLYWTNISGGGIAQPVDKGVVLKDILQENVEDKYYHSEAAINYMNRSVNDGRNHWDFSHHSDSDKDKSSCITANFKKGVPYNVLIDRDNVSQINPYSGCSTSQPKMQHRIFNSESKSTALTSFSSRLSIYPDKENLIRRLTPVECERLQTLPDNYTCGVSDSHRYSCIGNGWTVDVIAHILSYYKK